MFDLKTILITGAGRGIGRSCAEIYAAKKVNLILCSKTKTELDKTAAEVLKINPEAKILICPCDVSDELSVAQMFEEIKNKFGRLDAVINNAGIFHSALIEEMKYEDWLKVFSVNIHGMFLCSQKAFTLMKDSKSKGVILNVSSLAGIYGQQKFAGTAAYSASKYAVIGLTEVLAVEGKPYGIRANCIAPGAVNTKMLQEAAPAFVTPTQPADIAKLIVNLCDDSSAILSGSVLEVFCNE